MMWYVLGLIVWCTYSTVLSQDSWRQPFEECAVDGSITLYDYHRKVWMSSDLGDSQVPTLPASTFKIVNTLIALETGAVSDEQEIIPWIDDYDTTRYGHRPNIYHSLSMKEAFRLSAGWAYVELAKRIGKDRYRNILTEMGYGNVDLSFEDPDFWNFGPFAISPMNQIEVLLGIYEERFSFSKRSYATLKEMMVEEQTGDYVIRAKTGWTRADGRDTGWWVGYIEQPDNVYFFATRLIKDRSVSNENFGRCRKDITKTILKSLGVL